MKAGYPPLLIHRAERRRYIELMGDYPLPGALRAGQKLVREDKKHQTLNNFFQQQWQPTIDLLMTYENVKRLVNKALYVYNLEYYGQLSSHLRHNLPQNCIMSETK